MGDMARVREDAERRAQAVADTVLRMPQLMFVLINSKKISGWEPESPLWPMFEKNAETMLGPCGEDQGHNLSAQDANEVAARFQQVADMMYDDAPDDSDDEG